MNIIEYIYVFSKRKYEKLGENDINGLMALTLVAFLLFINCLTIDYLLLAFKIRSELFLNNKINILVVFFTLLLLVYIYVCLIKKIDKINNKNTKYSSKSKIASLLYVIITVLLWVSMVIYRQS
jgi:Ni/Fe-hydrogenase subunit HybB-like protein